MRSRRNRLFGAAVACVLAALLTAPIAFAQQVREPPTSRPGPPYVLEQGYSLTKIADGMQFLVSITIDPQDNLYVVNNACPWIDGDAFAGHKKPEHGERWGWAELVKIAPDGSRTTLLSERNGQLKCSVNGVTYHDGKLYISDLGRIDTYDLATGEFKVIIDNLPWGDHYVDKVAFGPDGKGYFGIGTATNSGVVGADDDGCCWSLKDFPDKHEILPYDVVLTGVNFTQDFGIPLDCLTDAQGHKLAEGTGALVPFGTLTQPGQVIKGQKKANTTVNRFDPADPEGTYEVYASGFRHPYGIAWSPNGKLYVVNNGPDIRGCRPIGNGVPDDMWEVEQGDWAGWPEVFSGLELDNPGLTRLDGTQPPSIFTRESRPGPAKQPFLRFAPHTSSNGIAFSKSNAFGYVGDAFVAQFGSLDPATSGGVPVNTGKKIVRVAMNERKEYDFFTSNNWGPDATGPRRPVDLVFSNDGSKLYFVDYGLFATSTTGPQLGYGAVWMIQRTGAGAAPSVGAQPAVTGTRVNIVDNPNDPTAWGYSPPTVTVNVGDTVTWVNTGANPHTATADDGSWDTGLLEPGLSGSMTFSQPGTYTYHCIPHPWMKGTVVVAAAGAARPAPGGPAPTRAAGPAGPGVAGAQPAQVPRALPRTGDSGDVAAALAGLGVALAAGGAALRRRSP